MARPSAASFLWACLLPFALSATAVLGQDQQAETIRISDDPVFLHVTVDGIPMRLKVANGEMARITSSYRVLGLTPRLTKAGVELHLLQVVQGMRGGERIRQVAMVPLRLGQRSRFATTFVDLEAELLDPLALPPLPAEWSIANQGDSAAALGAPGGLAGDPRSAPCTRCCVTCGGVTLCACEVWMACGWCCCASDGCGTCTGVRSVAEPHPLPQVSNQISAAPAGKEGDPNRRRFY